MTDKVISFSIEPIDLKNLLFFNVKKRLNQFLLQFCLIIFLLFFLNVLKYLTSTKIFAICTVCIIFIVNLFIKDYIEINNNIFKDPYLREEKTLIFSEDKIALKQKNLQTIVNWKDISHVIYQKNVYFFDKSGAVPLLIPIRIFSSEKDIFSFQEYISKKTKIIR